MRLWSILCELAEKSEPGEENGRVKPCAGVLGECRDAGGWEMRVTCRVVEVGVAGGRCRIGPQNNNLLIARVERNPRIQVLVGAGAWMAAGRRNVSGR